MLSHCSIITDLNNNTYTADVATNAIHSAVRRSMVSRLASSFSPSSSSSSASSSIDDIDIDHRHLPVVVLGRIVCYIDAGATSLDTVDQRTLAAADDCQLDQTGQLWVNKLVHRERRLIIDGMKKRWRVKQTSEYDVAVESNIDEDAASRRSCGVKRVRGSNSTVDESIRREQWNRYNREYYEENKDRWTAIQQTNVHNNMIRQADYRILKTMAPGVDVQAYINGVDQYRTTGAYINVEANKTHQAIAATLARNSPELRAHYNNEAVRVRDALGGVRINQ